MLNPFTFLQLQAFMAPQWIYGGREQLTVCRLKGHK
jgi:hypothetical protein